MAFSSNILLLAAVVVGTWNGNWFPSGNADYRAPADVEAVTIADAGRLLARGLAAVDPCGTNDVIICLNEIRDRESASALAAAVGRTNLVLAAMSAYRWKDGYQKQQDVILTTLPIAAGGWSLWKIEKNVRPPRGHAYADVILTPAVTASVYAVHLKADYGAKDPEIRAENRKKREASVRQLVALTKEKKAHFGEMRPRGKPVVIAGDFNTDPARSEFAGETTISDLVAASYLNVMALLPPAARVTHPSAKFGGSALDYIFVRGLTPVGAPRIVSSGGLSDHDPVFVLMSLPSAR